MRSEMWFREFERQISEGEDAGLSSDAAYRQAGERANTALSERLLDAADRARLRQKEEQGK